MGYATKIKLVIKTVYTFLNLVWFCKWASLEEVEDLKETVEKLPMSPKCLHLVLDYLDAVIKAKRKDYIKEI